jgi:hypothetical protein
MSLRTALLLLAFAGVGCSPAAPPLRAPPPHVQLARPNDDDFLETRVARGPLVFVFRVSAVANLAYQLDCLTEQIPCSGGAYHEVWDASLTPGDREKLAAWRATEKTYSGDVELDAGPLPPTAVPIPFLGLEYDKQVREASFMARSLDDDERLLSVLLRPSDARALAEVERHFWPRFHAWWTASGRAMTDTAFRRFPELLGQRADLHELVEAVARFYGGKIPPGTEVVFDLVARPKSAARATSAEHVGHHLVIEVLEGEQPDRRMGVVLHELFHYFHASRSAAAKAALIERFAASSDPLGIVAYYLVDEGLATAFGNGLVERLLTPDDYKRRMAQEGGLYNNRGIDRTAKALLPRAEELLRGSLDDAAFVPTFLAAVHTALGDAPPPIEYLRSSASAYALPYADAKRRLQEAAHANHTYNHSFPSVEAIHEFADHPGLSGALLLSKDDVPRLAEWSGVVPAPDLRAIQGEVKRGGPFVYPVARSRHAFLFVMVADDAAAMNRLVAALAARQTRMTGVLRLD